MGKHSNLCCNICCSIICFGLTIAAIATGIVFAVDDKNEIGYPHHLWYWCVIDAGLMFVGLLNHFIKMLFPVFVVEINEDDSKKVKIEKYIQKYVINYRYPVDIILGLLGLGMIIWGCIIYSELGLSGGPYAHNLWTWFKVMFWFSVSVMGLFAFLSLILFCLMLTACLCSVAV